MDATQHLKNEPRFERRKDARPSELTAAAFAERLRTEVDLDAVASDLTGSVEHVLRPRKLALWLRTPES